MALFIALAVSNSVSLAQTRISFKRGKSSATYSGRLAPHATRTYVIKAREGQTLRIAMKGDVSYEVLSNDAVTSMSGSPDSSDYNLTRSGDYVIKLENGGKAKRFTMTVSVLNLN
jgi:hypothetical protein